MTPEPAPDSRGFGVQPDMQHKLAPEFPRRPPARLLMLPGTALAMILALLALVATIIGLVVFVR